MYMYIHTHTHTHTFIFARAKTRKHQYKINANKHKKNSVDWEILCWETFARFIFDTRQSGEKFITVYNENLKFPHIKFKTVEC